MIVGTPYIPEGPQTYHSSGRLCEAQVVARTSREPDWSNSGKTYRNEPEKQIKEVDNGADGLGDNARATGNRRHSNNRIGSYGDQG
jgi:hypothetical protein